MDIEDLCKVVLDYSGLLTMRIGVESQVQLDRHGRLSFGTIVLHGLLILDSYVFKTSSSIAQPADFRGSFQILVLH